MTITQTIDGIRRAAITDRVMGRHIAGRRGRRAAALIAGAAVAATSGLAAAAPALAAVGPQATSATVTLDLGRLSYDGGSGNTNNLLVRRESGVITVSDSVALSAGAGCRLVTSRKATCGSGNLLELRAFLRDGNDSADIQVATANGQFQDTSQVIGGDGDDFFRAGRSTTGVLYLGGSGRDEVSYFGAAQAVTVTLDNKTNDGPFGRDNVLEAEKLSGSPFADRLTGSSRSGEEINGDGGGDTIDPGAGAGADTVFGSIGNDTLLLRDTVADVADGGIGTDSATVDRGLDRVSNVESIR